MLEVDNIFVNYGQSQVLRGLSLRVDPGEVVAVMGRNGAGKTTMMRAIMGLTPARAGRCASTCLHTGRRSTPTAGDWRRAPGSLRRCRRRKQGFPGSVPIYRDAPKVSTITY